jgi:hypothetical protein
MIGASQFALESGLRYGKFFALIPLKAKPMKTWTMIWAWGQKIFFQRLGGH